LKLALHKKFKSHTHYRQ